MMTEVSEKLTDSETCSAEHAALLSAVWLADDGGNLRGVHYIAHPTSDGWRHHPVKTIADAVAKALAISNAGGNAYFACAEYITPPSRKAENVRQARAFWVDLDCGVGKASEGKGYSTKREAAEALSVFRQATGIPAPSAVVDSGNGLHVYWILDAPVSAEEWKPAAAKLKALAAKHSLLADPSRTSDLASVLRVPGTMNWKEPAQPKPVKLKYLGGSTSWAALKTILEATSNETPGGTPGNLGDLTAGMATNCSPMQETPENVERVRSMLAAIPADCGRDEWRNIVWAVLSTGLECAEQLARDWSMTAPGEYDAAEFDKVVRSFNPSGGITLGTLVHHARHYGLVEQRGDPVKVALHEYNSRYFVARIGGGVFVFDERDEELLKGAMAFTAFRQLYAGHMIDGANAASKWLNWADRRTYHTVAFNPSGRTEAGVYNTWRGFAVTPAPGKCDLIIEHIRAILCGGNEGQFHYVIRWMAMLVQRPWEKPEVALVLRSREGSGKTIIVDILLRIFGVHSFTAAQKEQVAGRFNGHLFDKVLVVLEEAFFAGDPAAVAVTKALVTNKTLGYEAKGKDSFNAASHAHVISLTNHGWAVPAGEDSRRWMVFDVDDSRKGDHAYFQALSEEIGSGGTEAFLHYLLDVDLAGWNPRALPSSAALLAQRAETLRRTNPVAAWWLHVLAEGEFTVEGGAVSWGEEISAADIQESYTRATARSRGAPAWDTAAKKLRDLLPAGGLGKQRKSSNGTRSFFYALPDLDDARAHFEKATGVDPCAA
ncbi:MAG: DUF5906 domain-containing protein [Betaproteobacteria bacterium]|nr:DUF5906 domain-containing protein [Betaproteobacteria bacterium]